MKTFVVLAMLMLWTIGCGSDFATGESSDRTLARPASSADITGGAPHSDIVPITTTAAGSAGMIAAVVTAGTSAAVGGANGSAGATSTTSAIIVASSIARVLYWSSSPAGASSSIETEIELINISKSDWDLTQYRLRYWFSAELQGGAALVPEMGSGSLATQQISIGNVVPSRPGLDHYIELAFAKGTILAGSSERLTFAVHQSNWGLFDQDDDYSYPGGLVKGSELATVGVYCNGVLIAGIEP